MNQQNQTVNFTFYVTIVHLCIIANITALIFQFWYYELPCPLCLLQRFGFLAVSYGAIAKMQHNKNTVKYDLMIVFSVIFTLIVAVRQILLHIAPNNHGYGSVFLGLHFYSWSALISFIFLTAMAILPIVDTYLKQIIKCLPFNPDTYQKYVAILKVILLTLTLINTIATYLECGFSLCPSNPTKYLM